MTFRKEIEKAVKEYKNAFREGYKASEIWGNMDTVKIWTNKYMLTTNSVIPENRYEICINHLVNNMNTEEIEKAIEFFQGKTRTEIEEYININGKDYLK